MSGSSANLMVPHAGNRMAPLNAKTILIIDELPARRRSREKRRAGTTKEKGAQPTTNERARTQRAIVFELHSLKQSG